MTGLSPDQRNRLAVVLVRARNPNNIGAAARAMHDFGFSRLGLVNDYPVPFQTARSAVDAGDILQAATEFPTVAEAVTACTLVIGTTAVGERDLEHPLLVLPEAALRVQAALRDPDAQVGVLFGSEKTGLSNDELSHCHCLLTIPMHQHAGIRHPSMNLGQAVAVCLYELIRPIEASRSEAPAAAAHLQSPETAAEPPAPAAQVERLSALLAEVLEAAEYGRHHPANSDVAQIRRMAVRLAATAADLPVWLGMLRQILWKVRGGSRQDRG